MFQIPNSKFQIGSTSVKHSVLQVNIKFLAKAGTDLDLTGLEVEDHELEEEHNCTMVIASNIVQHRELLETAARSLADGGCILARENVDTESVLASGFRLNVVFEKTLNDEKLLLLRKVTVTIVSFQNRLHLPFHHFTSAYDLVVDVEEVGGGRGDWMELAQDRDRWRVLVNTVKKLRVP
jgi:hypothetical protein